MAQEQSSSALLVDGTQEQRRSAGAAHRNEGSVQLALAFTRALARCLQCQGALRNALHVVGSNKPLAETYLSKVCVKCHMTRGYTPKRQTKQVITDISAHHRHSVQTFIADNSPVHLALPEGGSGRKVRAVYLQQVVVDKDAEAVPEDVWNHAVSQWTLDGALRSITIRRSNLRLPTAVVNTGHVPFLSTVDFSYYDGVSDGNAFIKAVANHCPRLTTLSVAYSQGSVNDDAISAIAMGCPALSKLLVSYSAGAITHESIHAVASQCRKITHLDVSGTGGAITDESIIQIAQSCPKLTALGVASANNAITNEGLLRVASLCAGLQFLNVAQNDNISDAALQVVASKCRMLTHVDICDTFGKVTDVTVNALAANCPHLTFIDVSDTEGAITDSSMCVLANKCRKLRSVAFRTTKEKITDAFVQVLAENCPGLTALYAGDTGSAISDAAVISVAQKCPNLLVLDVQTARLTAAAVQALAAQSTQLHRFHVPPKFNESCPDAIQALEAACVDVAVL